MLNFLRGIQLYCSPEVSSKEPRVWLSSGVLRATEANLTQEHYSETALIPAEPWREPNKTEQHFLYRNNVPTDSNTSVCVIRIPAEILALFEELGVSSLKTAEESIELTRSLGYKHATEKLLDYLEPFRLNDQKLTLSGIGISPPGLNTVTFNPVDQCYIGLHLDSWDQLPLLQRHRATNRICINLGHEARFLLFINLSVMDILSVLQLEGAIRSQQPRWWTNLRWAFRKYHLPSSLDAVRISPPSLIQKFMEGYPDYPVVKVKIAPGEAYIAPTENMIHDGCSLGQTQADVQLTVRGYFGIT